MSKPKPEDVIKALEHCSLWGKCKGCPYEKVPYKSNKDCCTYNSTKDALALLREKDARIEELEAELKRCSEKSNIGRSKK